LVVSAFWDSVTSPPAEVTVMLPASVVMPLVPSTEPISIEPALMTLTTPPEPDANAAITAVSVSIPSVAPIDVPTRRTPVAAVITFGPLSSMAPPVTRETVP